MEGSSSSRPTLIDSSSPVQTPRSNPDPTVSATCGTSPSVEEENDAADNSFQRKKRAKTYPVWAEFREVLQPDNTKKAECIHYSMAAGSSLPPLIGGKFEMARMRGLVAQGVFMHEHQFRVVEQEGFNNLLKYLTPGWEKISRFTSKNDCMKVYEMENERLKAVLNNIDRISLTTDLWNSSNQKLEYMVVTGHWIDTNWRLNKRVLSFVRLPPPRGGVQIADSIFNCLRE
ncbi:zinc finger BED domain-containing protein DAYSLEEPER-like [Pistacia vera]|uniref:zinc finger BED domain-containing protein DAYSLEEPER-like n=1 Tax=Pistacia vera TaxID=55513 RepID=UPI0012636D47|nr:zinc finger BED domain-containing protein DAYSLEEPER-like [Pistacia vera]